MNIVMSPERIHVLVIDNDRNDRKRVVQIAMISGHSTIEIADTSTILDDVITAISNHKVGIAFVDQVMANASGIKVLERICEFSNRTGKKIFPVLYSGFLSKEVDSEARKLGAECVDKTSEYADCEMRDLINKHLGSVNASQKEKTSCLIPQIIGQSRIWNWPKIRLLTILAVLASVFTGILGIDCKLFANEFWLIIGVIGGSGIAFLLIGESANRNRLVFVRITLLIAGLGLLFEIVVLYIFLLNQHTGR